MSTATPDNSDAWHNLENIEKNGLTCPDADPKHWQICARLCSPKLFREDGTLHVRLYVLRPAAGRGPTNGTEYRACVDLQQRGGGRQWEQIGFVYYCHLTKPSSADPDADAQRWCQDWLQQDPDDLDNDYYLKPNQADFARTLQALYQPDGRVRRPAHQNDLVNDASGQPLMYLSHLYSRPHATYDPNVVYRGHNYGLRALELATHLLSSDELPNEYRLPPSFLLLTRPRYQIETEDMPELVEQLLQNDVDRRDAVIKNLLEPEDDSDVLTEFKHFWKDVTSHNPNVARAGTHKLRQYFSRLGFTEYVAREGDQPGHEFYVMGRIVTEQHDLLGLNANPDNRFNLDKIILSCKYQGETYRTPLARLAFAAILEPKRTGRICIDYDYEKFREWIYKRVGVPVDSLFFAVVSQDGVGVEHAVSRRVGFALLLEQINCTQYEVEFQPDNGHVVEIRLGRAAPRAPAAAGAVVVPEPEDRLDGRQD